MAAAGDGQSGRKNGPGEWPLFCESSIEPVDFVSDGLLTITESFWQGVPTE